MKLRTLMAFIVSIFILVACSKTTIEQVDGLNSQASNTNNNFWQPEVGTPWHYQLGQPISRSDAFLDEVKVYSIDVFDNTPTAIAFLKSKDIKVICYINVGAWESWRPDAGDFPESLKLGNYTNWAGERWLDIRPPDKLNNPADGHKLRDLMKARFTEAVNRGCDAIEPDNLDSWNPNINLNNGQPREFEISYQDQLEYNIWLAQIAHEKGLSIGLKSNVEQAADLVDYYDWALNESCTHYQYLDQIGVSECQYYQESFIAQKKAVFWVEYKEFGGTTALFCPTRNETEGFSLILGTLDLQEDATQVYRCENLTTPEPDPTPEPNPTPEPDPTPEPNPEPDPTPEPNPTPNPVNLLSNASFTNGLDSWENSGCGNGIVTVTSGNQLNITSGTNCAAQAMVASVGNTYTLSCTVKNTNDNYSEMALFFKDGNNSVLSVAHLPIINTAFETVTVSETAPAGTSRVYVSFFTVNGDLTVDSCLFDTNTNSTLTPDPTPNPIPDPTLDPENLLYNGDFENDLKGWRKAGCGLDTITTIDGAGISHASINSIDINSAALHITGNSECIDQSNPATAATTYTFTCQAKNIGKNYGEIGIYFENSKGTMVRAEAEAITTKQYQSYSVTAIAPKDAVSVIADIYVFETEMFVDDCVMTQSN